MLTAVVAEGCAVAPVTVSPLTFGYPGGVGGPIGAYPGGYPVPAPPPVPPPPGMQSHIRLPSCGQCHR